MDKYAKDPGNNQTANDTLADKLFELGAVLCNSLFGAPVAVAA